jgi:hypothetical protein
MPIKHEFFYIMISGFWVDEDLNTSLVFLIIIWGGSSCFNKVFILQKKLNLLNNLIATNIEPFWKTERFTFGKYNCSRFLVFKP